MYSSFFLIVAASCIASHAFEIPCVSSFTPINHRFAEVRIDHGALTWPDMDDLCNEKHPGYGILTKYEYLEREVLDLCADQKMVPFGVALGVDGVVKWNYKYDIIQLPLSDEEMIKMKFQNGTGVWGVLHWPSDGVSMIGSETHFSCAVCELYERANVVSRGVYPPHNNSVFAYDLELLSYDSFEDIGIVANGSDLTNRLLEELAEAFDISAKSLRWHSAMLTEEQKAVVHVYYNPEGVDMDWFYYVHWNDEYLDHKTIKKFEITRIKLNTECVTDKELKHVNEKAAFTGTLEYSSYFEANSFVTLRECYWNASAESAAWSPRENWLIHWHSCSFKPLYKQTDPYDAILRTIDLSASFQFNYLVANAPQSFDMRALLGGIDISIKMHSSTKSNSTLTFVTTQNLNNIATMFMRCMGKDSVKTHLDYYYPFVHVVQKQLNKTNPFLGATISIDNTKKLGAVTVSEIQPLDTNALTTTNITVLIVTVSDSIAHDADQLVVAFYATHNDDDNILMEDPAFGTWLSVIQVTYQRQGSDFDVHADYVDIAFAPDFRDRAMSGKCAQWDHLISSWSGQSCRLLASRRESMLVCRCKNLYQLFNSSVVTGVYIIYGYDASLSSYLADNRKLVWVTSVALTFSAIAIVSIYATAIAFKNWRAKVTNKILMHMTFALGVNIFLVSLTNFFKFDTKSCICIVIGVFRHYSFQAMFYWMLVLSVCQMKVLTAKKDMTTSTSASNPLCFLLKLSLFAWGCPLIPIIILLAWDTGFYRSIIYNRGYCYPEGIAFELTVQAPAGVVLAMNLVLFAYVLVRNYGCCSRKEDSYHRQNKEKRTTQIRRMAKFSVLFLIFGFTWLFHFLSEEGIINNEFMFEFCFIITVAVYLCVLSFFFVVMNGEARGYWVKAWHKRMVKGCFLGGLRQKFRYGSFGRNSSSSMTSNTSMRMSNLEE